MTTSTTATIHFAPEALAEHFELIKADLQANGFPVTAANLAESTLSVDASSDPNDYSILMAATQALTIAGGDEEDVLFAELD